MGHKGEDKVRHPKKSVNASILQSFTVPESAREEPKSYVVPSSAREIAQDPRKKYLVFRFDCIDMEDDCPWSLKRMSESEHGLLLEKLKDFETLTVGELFGDYAAFKLYQDFTLCPNQEPVSRLGHYYSRNGDAIARFRLGGKERLYGFLTDNEFHIVWWDAEHQIWPSAKKNT